MSVNTGRSNVPPGYVVGFDQELTTGETNEILATCARLLLDDLSPSGWEAAGLFISDCIAGGEFTRLCDYDPDVLDLTPSDCYLIFQCLALFKKRQDLDLGIDRKAAAWEKFQEAERACKTTNDCFRAWSQGRFQFRPGVERALHAAQRKISELLERYELPSSNGPHVEVPSVVYPMVPNRVGVRAERRRIKRASGARPVVASFRPRFGPGSSTQTKKQNACLVVKTGSMPACSANFTPISEALSASFIVDRCDPVASWLVEVPIHTAVLQFVPKNATIDRAIVQEPALNSMFQLGVGDVLADLLRRVGIDIRDQSRNQRAALYGSISGEVATLDLSSASDTVARYLVWHLFPPDWVELFENLRSAEVSYKLEKHMRMEKISSMGNGFTFPLETIIFWALAQSVTEIYAGKSQRPVLVYGDDIIVPTDAAVPLMDVLRDLGFTPNAKKSFWFGSFRESCGSDYLLGSNVRPVFVDDALKGADFFRLHNFFHAKGNFRVASKLRSYVHSSIHLTGPKGYGDGHMHVNAGESFPFKREDRKGWGGFTFETFTFSVKHLRSEIADLIATTRRLKVPVWDPAAKDWSKNRKETVSRRIYSSRQEFAVRRLATYTQMQRESRTLTLTRVDEAMNCGQHVYCDRRMPDPTIRTDDDVFVVPGDGLVKRAKVYIFEPPTEH